MIKFKDLSKQDQLSLFSYWLDNKGSKTKYIERMVYFGKREMFIKDTYPHWSGNEVYRKSI